MVATQNHSNVPNIESLHTYWRSLAGGAVPDRLLLDPAAIKPLLPYICLVDFETDPFRVRYRLTGTKVDEFNGFNLTSRYVDQMLADDSTGGAAHILECYRRCWETSAPYFSAYLWPRRSGGHLSVQFAMLPLGMNGVTRQCIAIEDWEYSLEPIALEAVPLPGDRVRMRE